MIPKIIHQVWPGLDPCPTFLSEAIQRRHPDWEYKLWTPDNFPRFRNQELYDSTSLYNMKSNIARFEILYQFGGFYADLDWISVKPFDDLLQNEYVLTREFAKGDLVADFLIGCLAKWDFMDTVLSFIQSNSMTLACLTRPSQTPAYAGSGMLRRLTKNKGMNIFPSSLFNPYDHIHEIKRMSREEALNISVPDYAYGYHLYCHFTKKQG